jgi:hypothetical protein
VALKRAGRWLGGLRECTRKKRGGGQLRGKEGGGRASTCPGTRFGREWLVGYRWSRVARFGPSLQGTCSMKCRTPAVAQGSRWQAWFKACRSIRVATVLLCSRADRKLP